MAARLILVRHGPSTHPERGLTDHAGVQAWRDAYDAAGIPIDVQPPRHVIDLARTATHVITSDLRRAMESAERLAPRRPIQVSTLMREAPLPIPPWSTHLPLRVWGSLMYVRWSWRRLLGTHVPGADEARAVAAARWLTDLAVDGTTALVVTHGVFRKLVAAELRVLGWMGAGRRGGYAHWSCWHFARADGMPPLPDERR